MPGFSGAYSHIAGDQFIFKGGVTWPAAALPFNIGYGGTSGHVDTYGGEDQTWYTGGAWAQPIFDQANTSWYEGWAVGSSANSFVKFDNVFVKNTANAQTGTATASGSTTVLTDSTQNWTSSLWGSGYYIYDLTDGSNCQVTSWGATTQTCSAALAGGTNNHWTSGDTYYITSGTGTAISIVGGSNVEISNNTIQPHSLQSVAYDVGLVNNAHIYIHGNNISYGGRFIVYSETGHVLDDVNIYSNRMQGSGSTPLGDMHLDGLMIGDPDAGCINGGPPYTATVTHINFYDNYFYGSWPGGPTALYFSNACTNYTNIYNNVFALETTDSKLAGYIMRWQAADGNISVLNNTMSSDGNPGFAMGASGAMLISPTYAPHYGTLVIKGNIFSGFGLDITGDTFTSFSSIGIDYNLHYPSTAGPDGRHHIVLISGTDCDTVACAQSTWGYEMHSPVVGNPEYVAEPSGTPGSGNYNLQASSPAIGAGVDLSAIFTTDLTGATRTVPWDIGAYKYAGGGGTTPSASLSTATLSFGNQAILTTSSAQTVTITSNGQTSSTLAITNIGLATGTSFAISGGTCGTGYPINLTYGQSCTATVTFTPTALGALTDTLTFTDNAGGTAGTMQTVGLSGTGISGGSTPATFGSGTWGSGTLP
jgi:hypothetical protein